MDEEQIIEDLILNGALEVAGIDMDTGEALYNFTDKLPIVAPELHDEMSRYFSRETLYLWQNGFLEMDVTEANPLVRLTDKAFDASETLKLEKESQYTLKEIARILNDKSGTI
jgi:hypothetical protein